MVAPRAVCHVRGELPCESYGIMTHVGHGPPAFAALRRGRRGRGYNAANESTRRGWRCRLLYAFDSRIQL